MTPTAPAQIVVLTREGDTLHVTGRFGSGGRIVHVFRLSDGLDCGWVDTGRCTVIDLARRGVRGYREKLQNPHRALAEKVAKDMEDSQE